MRLATTRTGRRWRLFFLHLIRSGRVSVAWAGKRIGLDRWQTLEWYTSHGFSYPDYTEVELKEDLHFARTFPEKNGG